MLGDISHVEKIYIRTGYTDMRKQLNGLVDIKAAAPLVIGRTGSRTAQSRSKMISMLSLFYFDNNQKTANTL